MKNNQLAGILLGLLFLSALASAGLTFKYNSSIRKLQQMGPQLNNGRGLIQALLTDTTEYAKTHPDINRVLQPYMGGGKPPTPTTSATPATAPAKPNK